jgi:hypothetical protein
MSEFDEKKDKGELEKPDSLKKDNSDRNHEEAGKMKEEGPAAQGIPEPDGAFGERPSEALLAESEPGASNRYDDILSRNPKELTNHEKGEWGEAATARMMEEKGYTQVGAHIKPQGIDSVWERGDSIIMIESKFRTDGKFSPESQMKLTADGQPTSMDWVFSGRLQEACGENFDRIYNKICNHGYETQVAVIKPSGEISTIHIDPRPPGWLAETSPPHSLVRETNGEFKNFLH